MPDNLSIITVNFAFTLSLVEEKLFDKHKNIWSMNHSSQSKLRTYATYKVEYAVESYVEANVSRSTLFYHQPEK